MTNAGRNYSYSARWIIAGLLTLGLVAMAAMQYSPTPLPAQAEQPAPAKAAVSADESPPARPAAQLVSEPSVSGRSRPRNPLDAVRAFRYLQQICALGPRPSGSSGMLKQQELVTQHFEQLGGQVRLQKFQAKNPLDGEKLPLANVIVEWHPERQERILLCAHYDTRPLPDRDPNPEQRRAGVFIGANDGASGVAVLMELAHLMPQLEGQIGVDFALFDGEELVYVDGRDPYFLGSTWFAQQYVRQPPEHQYRWGVLLDMVGDKNLQIYQEQHSIAWRDTRPLVKEIWATAARLGVKEFIPRAGYKILDDHLPLRNIGKIPTCDIIDAPQDYPAWHTTMDTPQRCSPASLAKVGWVVYEWLKMQK
jgi:glutaminyl-peptide cyclotransferase